eukprot:s1775_g9.t1
MTYDFVISNALLYCVWLLCDASCVKYIDLVFALLNRLDVMAAWHSRHWADCGGGLGRRWSPVTPRLFCVAACRLATSAFVFCGRRGTWRQHAAFVLCGGRGTHGTGLALVAVLVGAGVPLGDICLRFVAGVALDDISLRFVWEAWHSRHWAGSGGGLGRCWLPVTRCLFCVAGVALGASAFVLCGRRGPGDISIRFVWPAWHTAPLLRGRRGAWRHLPFCVATLALGDICLRFAWHAWRLATSAFVYVAGLALTALGWLWWRSCSALVAGDRRLATSAFVLRSRRGTWRHLPSLCAWQAWQLVTSDFVLCGKRGSHSTGPALVAALVSLLCGARNSDDDDDDEEDGEDGEDDNVVDDDVGDDDAEDHEVKEDYVEDDEMEDDDVEDDDVEEDEDEDDNAENEVEDSDGVLTKSLYKVPFRGLLARSLYEISIEAL